MNTTSGQQTRATVAGFTLAEVIVATTVLAIAMTAIMSSLVFAYKSSYFMGLSIETNSKSRLTMEQLGLDLRSAIDVTTSAGKNLKFTVSDPDGNTQTIQYRYISNAGTLWRRVDGGTKDFLLYDLDDFLFTYYDSKDVATTNAIDIKKIMVFMKQEKSVLNLNHESEYKSARFLLRNRMTSYAPD